MKKLLAIVLAATMCAAGFAGCGSSESSESSAPASSASDAGSEEASGSSSGTIKVGILAPLTGEVANYGMAARDGAKLYLDQVNANGGINGKQIEIVEYDEKGDATEAVNAFNRMVEDGVTAVIGDVTSKPTIAVAMESVDFNMPMITGTATASDVTSYGDNYFRSCFIDPFQGEKMASYAKEKLEAASAAVIYNNGDDYSKGLHDAFIAKCEELGVEVVGDESYAAGDVDFKSQLTNIMANSPDVLFCPDYYETVSQIAIQAREVGLASTLLGGDGWSSVLSAMTDATAVEGAYFCSGFSLDDTSEMVQTFVTDYNAAYGSDPDMFAAQSYDAAMILCAAIEAAEQTGTEPASDEYKQAIIDAMDATDLDCVTGHITYDELNNPIKDAVILTIKDGNYAFVEKY